MFGIRSCALVLAMMFAAGCTSYYKVSDPTTGKDYYTTEVKKRGSGAVTIKDAATGDDVTIQNSHVSKVTKEEYETNRGSGK
jgi:hypothetical protein